MPDLYNSARPALGSVSSYQVSGYPFVTGSSLTTNSQSAIYFPTVTKRIIIASRCGTPLQIHFAPKENNNIINGNHYFTLPSSGTLDLNVKCKEIYISSPINGVVSTGRFEIVAELTHIAKVEMYPLTGSGISI